MQEAVDRVPGGGRICLGRGEFRLRRFLAIVRDGVTLEGDGPATVLTLDQDVESPVLVIGDYENETPRRPIANVTIERLRIVGGGSVGREHHPDHPYLTNSAIVVRGGLDITLRDLQVSACRSACILTERDTRDVTIERDRLEGSVWDGISLNRTIRARVVGNVIRGNTSAAITAEHLEDAIVRDNVFEANRTHGVYLADSYRNVFDGNRFVRNVLSGVFLTCAVREHAPVVRCWKDSMSQGNVFAGNTFDGNRVAFTVAPDAAADCTRPTFEPNRSRGDRVSDNPRDEPYPAARGRCLVFDAGSIGDVSVLRRVGAD